MELMVVLMCVLWTTCHAGVISVNMTDSFMNAGSYWNKMRPDQGLEGASCFQSGSESDSFWKIALPDVVTISKVIINGSYHGALRVRVGNHNNVIGDMRGHDSNLLCRNLDINGDMTSLPFICDRPRTGNIVSISGATVSRNLVANLKLCQIQLVE